MKKNWEKFVPSTHDRLPQPRDINTKHKQSEHKKQKYRKQKKKNRKEKERKNRITTDTRTHAWKSWATGPG